MVVQCTDKCRRLNRYERRCRRGSSGRGCHRQCQPAMWCRDVALWRLAGSAEGVSGAILWSVMMRPELGSGTQTESARHRAATYERACEPLPAGSAIVEFLG